MTPAEFRDHLSRLGLSQLAAGRFLNYNGRTVRRWASGRESVPVVVQKLLEKLEPEDVKGA